MRTLQMLAAALLAAALFAPAMASSQAGELDAIRAQQAEIREGVSNRTGPYKGLDERKRDELLGKQTFVLRTIEGKHSSDELTQTERVEVFNALEWIEAAINDAEDDRMVCRVEKATGSNRHVRVCKTVAQMRQERERARQSMMKASRCGDPTCIGN